MMLYLFDVSILVLCSALCSQMQGSRSAPDIRVHPSSILLPVNIQADFECTVHCESQCIITWLINGGSAFYLSQKTHYMSQGFEFSDTSSNNDVYTNILSFIASDASIMNYWSITCSVRVNKPHTVATTSNTATLLVISESTVTPNPSVVSQSSNDSLLFKWSPPYLWPGSRLDYYNITITRVTDSYTNVTYQHLNATFRDALVSLMLESDQTCTRYMVEIFAVDDRNRSLETYTTVWRYEPDVFDMATINSTVFFLANITPIVRLFLKLPTSMCDYQELNYTIIFDSVNESSIMEEGPFYHRGPGTLMHDVVSDKLVRDEEYSVYAVISDYSNPNSTRRTQNESYFNTIFGDKHRSTESYGESCATTGDIFYYKIAIGVCVCIITLITSTLILVAICMSASYFQRNMDNGQPSAERISNALVPNPIYSGPIYASVQPKFESLTSGTHSQQAAAESASSTSLELCNSPASTSGTSSSEEKEIRYVDQPTIGQQQLPQFRSKSFAFGACSQLPARSDDKPTTHRCASISTSTNRKTGNKLHLQLSLGGNDGQPGHGGTGSGTGEASKARKEASGTNPMFNLEEDENYTLMSPVGTIAFSALREDGLSPEDVKDKYKE